MFVQSLDGNTVADDPSDLGGGDTDKHLIYEGLSRVAADAVMAGAATVAGGKIVFSVWHPELVRLRSALGKLGAELPEASELLTEVKAMPWLLL